MTARKGGWAHCDAYRSSNVLLRSIFLYASRMEPMYSLSLRAFSYLARSDWPLKPEAADKKTYLVRWERGRG